MYYFQKNPQIRGEERELLGGHVSVGVGSIQLQQQPL